MPPQAVALRATAVSSRAAFPPRTLALGVSLAPLPRSGEDAANAPSSLARLGCPRAALARSKMSLSTAASAGGSVTQSVYVRRSGHALYRN